MELLQLVLEGRLKARECLPGETGLRGLLFDSRDVADLTTPRAETLTLQEVAKRLESPYHSTRAWCDEGYLATSVSPSLRERGSRVTEEAFKDFCQDYLTEGQVAQVVGTVGRWARERLIYLGCEPVPSASRTKLFSEVAITPEVLTSLERGVKPGRREAAAAAFGLVRRVGDDIAKKLGLELLRAWNGYRDETGSVYVQVLHGRRLRFKSDFVFRFNQAMRRRLERAEVGWVALALDGYDSYVLLPWETARQLVGSDGPERHAITMAVSSGGQVTAKVLRGFQQWLEEPVTPRTQSTTCRSDALSI